MDFHQMKRMENASRIGFACSEAAGPNRDDALARYGAIFLSASLAVLLIAVTAVMGA